MPESFDRQVRAEVSRYLHGDLSLQDFNRWFMPVSWSAFRMGEPSLEQLVGSVGLLLAELSSGQITEANLRKELKSVTAESPSIELPERGEDNSRPRVRSRGE